MPPSKGVPSGPWIRASQRKMSSSEMGPAVMPSGGLEVRFLYSWKRRREAMEDAMVVAGWKMGGRSSGVEERGVIGGRGSWCECDCDGGGGVEVRASEV